MEFCLTYSNGWSCGLWLVRLYEADKWGYRSTQDFHFTRHMKKFDHHDGQELWERGEREPWEHGEREHGEREPCEREP